MSEGSPIARLRRAGLHDALLDLLGINEGGALGEIEAFLSWVKHPIVTWGRLRAVTKDARGRLNVGGQIGLPRRGAFDKIAEIGYRYAVASLRPEVVARGTGEST